MSNQSRFLQWKTNNPDSYEELLQRRKKRYRESEEFRQRQLKHTADWREKQRRDKQPKKRTPKPRNFQIDGSQVECWSAGRTADFLGVDKKTVTNLEKNGTIPTNHVVAPNRRRWWPAEFVQWLKPFFDVRKGGISAQELHRRVWIGWSEEQVRGVIPVVHGELREEIYGDTDQTKGEHPS